MTAPQTLALFAALCAASVALEGQEPNVGSAGPCKGKDWVQVSVGRNQYGTPVHSFTNVGPYPIFLHMASVRASGDFPPRALSLELVRLKPGESAKLTEGFSGRGFAYRIEYLNAAYLDFGKGIFTRCSDAANGAIKRALGDICSDARAAQSCHDQARHELSVYEARSRR